MPAGLLARWRKELEDLEPSERTARQRRRIEAYLDAGRGSCILANVECAGIVEDALLHGDGDRYRLTAWVIMPNHCHAVIVPQENWSLDRIVHSWKSFTAHRLAAHHGQRPIWHREYWDRYIRDARHYEIVTTYVHRNPVVAGLCADPGEWRFSSAWWQAHEGDRLLRSSTPDHDPASGRR